MAKRTPVYAALSGGVDSAVAASLLVEQGYDVTGVFIKIWQPEFLECTWEEDRLDAMRVAAALGIPFRTVDLSDTYHDTVIRDMLAGYRAGRTPNPDVLCNRAVKFGAFLTYARNAGASYVATGHHAQLVRTEHGIELHRGVDPEKDQTYFLWQLDQDMCDHSLFPVGGMTKAAVRRYARRRGLPVAEKPDSQGLCFVGDVDMQTFLTRFIDVSEGDVYALDGSRIGTHRGAALYTIGQRHGFDITAPSHAGVPHYVTAIDVTHNQLFVSTKPEDGKRRRILLEQTNWITGAPPGDAQTTAMIRYRQGPQACRLTHDDGTWSATFDTPQLAAPGQSFVAYQGVRCLGGGIIANADT